MSESGDDLASMPQVRALYHFARLRLPRIRLAWDTFVSRLENAYQRSVRTANHHKTIPPTRRDYAERIYGLDSYLCFGCMNQDKVAWELLFSTYTQADTLLYEALRKHACRFFPRDRLLQEEKVHTFWGNLIICEKEGQTPILERYDGARPLVPWLITVFDHWVHSDKRKDQDWFDLDENTGGASIPPSEDAGNDIWHELFADAARAWLSTVHGRGLLVIGLMWVFQFRQREVGKLLKVHEGTITRIRQELDDQASEFIQAAMERQGWTGDDLTPYLHHEMGPILDADPRLSIPAMHALLHEIQPDAVLPANPAADRI